MNNKNAMETASVKSALNDALSSLDKALEDIKNEIPKANEMHKSEGDEKTKTLDIKSVLESAGDHNGDTKPIDLKHTAKNISDVKVKSHKAEETVADIIAETIKDNVRRENAAKGTSDVIIKNHENEDVKIKEKKAKGFNGNKKFFYVLNSVFVTFVFVCIAAALMVLDRPSGFMQSENRNYATFPEFSFRSYFDGEYTQKISEYFTDTTPHREELKTAANAFTGLFGFKLDDTVIKNSNKNVNKEKFDNKITITTVTPATFPSKENTDSATAATDQVTTTVPAQQ